MRRALPLFVLAILAALGGPAFALDGPAHKAPAHHTAPAAAATAPSEPEVVSRSTSRSRHALHGQLNINAADPAALELLPGIGPVMAERIVAHRKAHPFRKVEDIVKVKGIGKKKLARLRPFLTISGPSTLAEEDTAPAMPAAEGAE